MALPMSRPIKLKSGVYYLQKRVPADLLETVGKPLVRFSLRTKDPIVAKERHAEEISRLTREWAALRSEKFALSHKQIVALTKHRYDLFQREFGDNPPDANQTQNEIDIREGIGNNVERLETWYGRAADSILSEHGIGVTPSARETLLRELHATDLQALAVVLRNRQGDYRPDPSADRFPELSLPEVTPTVRGTPRRETSIPHLFELWKRAHLAQGKAPNTIVDFERKLSSLVEFVDHDDASRMTPKEIDSWCDYLLHERGLSPKTVRDKYLAAAKAVFRIGVSKFVLLSDPSELVKRSAPRKKKVRPKGYTEQEARRILAHTRQPFPEASRISPRNRDAIRWIPWICAFTGARGGEAAQLRKADLIEVDGLLCLRITPEAGSTKTGNYRIIPVHPQLIEEGLVDFVKASPTGHLFFDLKPDQDPQTRAASAYKKVSYWVRETVGITDQEIQPNHAWRHRFKTICRDVDIGVDFSKNLMGHSEGSAEENYGEFSPKALYREISKLEHIRLG